MSSVPTIQLNELAQLAQAFYLDRQANGCTAATLVWYRKYVGALVAWLTAHNVTALDRVTPTHLRAFLVELQDRGLADRTRHHHASAARTFCNFAVAEGLLTVSPMLRVKMPRVGKDLLTPLSADQVRDLLDACYTDRDKAIILCLLDTGLRASEFVALNIGDLDGATGALTVHRGKGNKGRVVYVGLRAHKALIKYLLGRDDTNATAPLWVAHSTGERLRAWGLRRQLWRLGKRAGVECSPHAFRRTFAIESLRAGMNIYALAKLMGHEDISVLRRYLRLVETDTQTAHKQHGAVDSLLAKGR
jgi:integrase/recombinase XerD